jgi:hypothetical protein
LPGDEYPVVFIQDDLLRHDRVPFPVENFASDLAGAIAVLALIGAVEQSTGCQPGTVARVPRTALRATDGYDG